jgi:hypothetical protein
VVSVATAVALLAGAVVLLAEVVAADPLVPLTVAKDLTYKTFNWWV